MIDTEPRPLPPSPPRIAPRAVLWAALGLAAIAAASTAALRSEPARAAGTGCTAYFGGVTSEKGAVPELVLFNTGDATLTLDLLLRDASGTVLADRADELTLGPRQTLAVDLLEQLARDVDRPAKPYAGLLSVEVHGDAGFDGDVVIAHVAQYFGKRTKPTAAYVLRPVFVADDP